MPDQIYELYEKNIGEQPKPRQHYEVHCGNCGWYGMISQMRATYNSSSDEPEPACPMCLSDQWLEYKE